MPTISPVTLSIDASVDSVGAGIRLAYSVTFSAAEIAADTPFREVARLLGDDDAVLNREDEPIVDGGLLDAVVRPGGRAVIVRDLVKDTQLRFLNEDVVGPDEIVGEVTLSPQPAGVATSRRSNVVTLNVSRLLHGRG